MSSAGKVVRVNTGPTVPSYIDSSDDEGTLANQAFPVGGSAAAGAVVPVETEVADDVGEHLKTTDFRNVQTKLIDIDLVATPAELAQNGALATWRLPPQLLNQLKYNKAMTDRHTASGEHLAGNLNRCIPLSLKILQQQNTFPFAIGISAPGIMMDDNLHAHGSCLWRVPGQTPTMLVGQQQVFQPVNIVNRYAYNNYRMCTVEDLKQDVTFPAGRTAKGRSAIAVNSLAYQTLVQSLENGTWQDQLQDINVDSIFEPGRNATVEVTEKMGRDIVKFLEPQVEQAANSFVDLQSFGFEVVRADSQRDFSSAKNLIGEIVSSTGTTDNKKMKSDQLQTRSTFSIKAEFSFVLF